MTLPNLESDLLPTPTFAEVQAKELSHPPRILLLYGSNRERSYSRLAVMEAGRILERFGCEVKIFHPKGYLYLKMVIWNIQRLKSCMNCWLGLKAWFGVRLSGMVR